MSTNTPSYGKFVQWLPMIVIQLYLTLTVSAFAFGPWPWPVYDPTKLYSFLIAAQVALLLGYAIAIRRAPTKGMSMPRFRTYFFYALLLNILFVVPTAKARTGAWIPDIAGALADPGEAYSKSLDIRTNTPGPIEYLRVLLGPILFLTIPWAIYYWRSLSRLEQVGFVVYIGLWMGVAIGTGTRKALADLLIVAPWMILAGRISGHSRWTGSAARIPLILGGAGAYGFVQYFTTGQLTRHGGGAAAGTFGGIPIVADFEHWTVSGLSPLMKIAATQLVLYTTQGYYALGLALEKPWVPMFGVGHSTFLFRNVARILGTPELGEMPYPVRVTAQDGWDHLHLWDTIYPWLASDLSFPGTVVFMFFIGRLLGGSWKDSLGGRNPLAVAVVAQLLVLAFYIPANNQCCQDGEGFVAFYVLIAIWLLTRSALEPEVR